MAKERDWIDYANLGSNIAQNFQLHDLQRKLGDVATIQRGIESAAWRQAALERQRQLKEERTEGIRQHVFDAMKRLDELEPLLGPEHAGRHMEDCVALNLQMLGRDIQRKGVEVENVGTYEDKEKIYELCTRLLRLYKAACAQFSPSRKKEVELAAQYEEEMPGLLRLIGLETQLQQAQPIRAALAPLLKRREELRAIIGRCAKSSQPPWNYTAIGVVWMGLALPCWFGWSVMRGDEDRGWPFFFACVATVGSVFSFFQIRPAMAAKRARRELEPIEAEVSRLRSQNIEVPMAELEELRQQFGKASLEQLNRMSGERLVLIDSFQADFEDDSVSTDDGEFPKRI